MEISMKFLNKLKIGTRLLTSYAIMIFATMLMVTIAILSLKNISDRQIILVEENVKPLYILHLMASDIYHMDQSIRNTIFFSQIPMIKEQYVMDYEQYKNEFINKMYDYESQIIAFPHKKPMFLLIHEVFTDEFNV